MSVMFYYVQIKCDNILLKYDMIKQMVFSVSYVWK